MYEVANHAIDDHAACDIFSRSLVGQARPGDTLEGNDDAKKVICIASQTIIAPHCLNGR